MQKRRGVSLIVLSITILVMAILAATAIIALEDSGIIGRSKNTTNKQNQQQEYTRLQVIKNGVLTDNLGVITIEEYIHELKNKGIIEDTVITSNGNKIVTTKSGLEVYLKQDGKNNINISFEEIQPGLGELITVDNYGETVDYTVSVNGTTYSDWQIYYHNEEYVFLATTEALFKTTLDSEILPSTLSAKQKELYRIFQVGNLPKYELTDTVNGEVSYANQAVAELITDFGCFANNSTYGNEVVGAIGAPTIQLLVASWSAIGNQPSIIVESDKYGYKYNQRDLNDLEVDGLHILGEYNSYWLSSPCNYYGYLNSLLVVSENSMTDDMASEPWGIRPVVCLKASIPAKAGGNNGANWGLVK